MFQLEDWWVWDFWLVDDGTGWHLFHLQSPRTTEPGDRHWNASIGHAGSADLTNWARVGTALEPGPPGSWDETALWTGSIIRHDDGRWLMAYTGIRRDGRTATERIGLAWSDDLVRWVKDPDNPVLVSDPERFEQPGATSWQHGWRDPWLHRGDDGTYRMLISARMADGDDPYRRGAVVQAGSDDGRRWSIDESVAGTAGVFAQLEVPHFLEVEGRPHLVFSTSTDRPWPDPSGRPMTGVMTAVADDWDGPFIEPMVLDGVPTGARASTGRYAGRVVSDGADLWYLAFEDTGPEGFVGRVSDPMPVRLDGDGRLLLAPGADPAASGNNKTI